MISVKVTWTEEGRNGLEGKFLIGVTKDLPEVGREFSVSPKKNILIDFGEVLELKGCLPFSVIRTDERVFTLELISGGEVPETISPISIIPKKRTPSKAKVRRLIREMKSLEQQRDEDYYASRRAKFEIIRGAL